MFENTYIKQRITKAQVLREKNLNPYANGIKRTIKNADFLQKYEYLKTQSTSSEGTKTADTTNATQQNTQNETQNETRTETIVGRVRFIRLMGKACFIKIQDESAILQGYLSLNDLGEDLWEVVKKLLEVGDIVAVSGFGFVTKSGELSIHAKDFKILTKAIVPLPEKFHGLTDVELRYRQRYVDLIVNSEVREIFRLRSKIVSLVRKFFEEKGFLEVETPMLHPIPGGANAKPFITHHNALGVDRYLRIAPELYLKRLIVGGFEAVFELNRNFRNEGMDHSHNPEFSMIEFYWAYHTYEDLIALTKEFFDYLLRNLGMDRKLPFLDSIIESSDDKTAKIFIDFDEWQILSYEDSLEEVGEIPRNVIKDEQALREYLKVRGVKLESNMSYGKLLESAFGEFVESRLINPTFITQYPIDISPLARRNDADSSKADRFELFIGGKEIANGFSELNDPLDQLERFRAQVAQKEKGDEEAQYMDEDFVWALAYGMPPTAGQGIGIDRLVMLLTNSKTIKDVLLFPAMKPIKEDFTMLSNDEK